MTLTLRNDISHPGGGFALLEGSVLAGVTAITIENGFAPGQFLGEDGKWNRNPFAFPIDENAPGVLLLGPHIVDLVPTELQVELRSSEGRTLGQLFWADIIPSRNSGSIRATDVLEERRRRADQRETEERAALMLETAVKEQAAAVQKVIEAQALRDRAANQLARVAANQAAALVKNAEGYRRAEDVSNKEVVALVSEIPSRASIFDKGVQLDDKIERRVETISVQKIPPKENGSAKAITLILVGILVGVCAVSMYPNIFSMVAAVFDSTSNAVSIIKPEAKHFDERLLERDSTMVHETEHRCPVVTNESRLGDFSAQVAVSKNQEEAKALCSRLDARFSKHYFGFPHVLFVAGDLYRIRLTGSRTSMEKICQAIKDDGGSCFVTKAQA